MKHYTRGENSICASPLSIELSSLIFMLLCSNANHIKFAALGWYILPIKSAKYRWMNEGMSLWCGVTL